jgi:hypothetical protein
MVHCPLDVKEMCSISETSCSAVWQRQWDRRTPEQ